MNALIFFLIVFGLGYVSHEFTPAQPITNSSAYRAVKYSIPVDYSLAHDIMGYSDANPNTSPKLVTAYQFYIQYGNDVVIHILDPGVGMEFMGIFIKKWDFVKRKTETIHYMDQVRKYSIYTDTIQFSIEESRGHTTNLCINLTPRGICDSVSIVSFAGDAKYTVRINDTVPNLTFKSLFYPDIKYLPIKIFGVGYSNATISLEEMIYGKPAVDSLLQLFTFSNYDLIKKEDLDQIDNQEVIDLMEKFDRLTKRKD